MKIPQLPIRGAKTLAGETPSAQEQAFLSRQLAIIHCDVELPLKPQELAMRTPDTAALRELYTRFGIQDLAAATRWR